MLSPGIVTEVMWEEPGCCLEQQGRRLRGHAEGYVQLGGGRRRGRDSVPGTTGGLEMLLCEVRCGSGGKSGRCRNCMLLDLFRLASLGRRQKCSEPNSELRYSSTGDRQGSRTRTDWEWQD